MENIYITTAVSIGLAVLGYVFSKWKEREADWRKKKLEMYHQLFDSISGITGNDSTPEGQRAFAKSCNTIGLIASVEVIKKLQKFQMASKNNIDHDKCLTELLAEIRKDLNLPLKQDDDFSYRLWVSGVKQNQ